MLFEVVLCSTLAVALGFALCDRGIDATVVAVTYLGLRQVFTAIFNPLSMSTIVGLFILVSSPQNSLVLGKLTTLISFRTFPGDETFARIDRSALLGTYEVSHLQIYDTYVQNGLKPGTPSAVIAVSADALTRTKISFRLKCGSARSSFA